MGSLRFVTAGESHGPELTGILEGMPAGVEVTVEEIEADLERRMMGYGRGARMKIETDRVKIKSGVRAGSTLGSPITLTIENKDWENWIDIMDSAPDIEPNPRRRRVVRPRPGHADLTGSMKYDFLDARNVLERASARETAVRVAVGAVCRKFLGLFGIEIGSHIVAIGSVKAQSILDLPVGLNESADRSEVRCLDDDASKRMIEEIDRAKSNGDTLGGVAEIVVRGAMIGLGSHVSWDRKLDARLAQALMSIPAVKGVEIGMGFEAAYKLGSETHDEMLPGGTPHTGGVIRPTNRAGGLEGGITNGMPIVLRAAMKPIATLMKPLKTVNFETGEPANAQSERSDVTAVPAMGVIAEAMAAIVVANAVLEKFGADTTKDILKAVDGYLRRIEERWESAGQTSDT